LSQEWAAERHRTGDREVIRRKSIHDTRVAQRISGRQWVLKPQDLAVAEFVLHGMRYAFPPVYTGNTHGVPTSSLALSMMGEVSIPDVSLNTHHQVVVWPEDAPQLVPRGMSHEHVPWSRSSTRCGRCTIDATLKSSRPVFA
jgi:hypothetical protein